MQNVTCNYQAIPDRVVNFKAGTPAQYNSQVGMPMPSDTYEKTQQQKLMKKQSRRENWMTLAFISMAVASIGTFALQMLGHKASTKASKSAIKNVYENLAKAKGFEDMFLPDSLKGLKTDIEKQIGNMDEVVGRGGNGCHSILLFGPPGTGKTTFAKAIAKSIPNSKFVSIDITKLTSKYVGETEQNLNALIDQICADAAKAMEKYNSELGKVIGDDLVKSGDKEKIAEAISKAKAEGKKVPEPERIFVFIDEIDSVMMEDKGSGAKYSNDVLNEFKKGFTEKLAKHDNIITIGATNLEIDAEKAALGNGKTLDKPMLDRFALKIRVPNPDKSQIKNSIIHNYKNCPSKYVAKELIDENSAALDALAEYMANERHGVSFRTLNTLFDKTANKTTGSGKPVSIKDLKASLKEMKEDLKMSDDGIDRLDISLD